MQILRTHKKLLPQIKTFFRTIEDNEYFHPHSFGSDYARTIAEYKGKNHFYFLTDEDENDKILGYAILRGFDEGWKNKCIGVCVPIDEQRRGYAEILCRFLELVAKRRGIHQLRLHAARHNNSALSLYGKLGYEPKRVRKNGELVLFKELI